MINIKQFKQLKPLKPLHIICLLSLLAVLFIIYNSTIGFLPRDMRLVKEDVVDFNTDWSFQNQDGEQIINLPGVLEADRNTEYTISKQLPEQLPADVTLCIRTRLQKITAVIDGQVVYQYGYRQPQPYGEIIPAVWNFISVDKNQTGKNIELTFSSPYRNASGTIMEIFYGSQAACLSYIWHHYLPYLLAGIVLFILGALLVLLILLTGKYRNYYEIVKYLGVFIVMISLWLLTKSWMLQFFTGNMILVIYTEIFVLMLLLTPYLLFLKELDLEERSQKIIVALMYVFWLNFLCMLLLHLFKICSLLQTLWITHVLIIVTLLLLSLIMISEVRNGKKQLTLFCIITVILTFVFGIIIYINYFHTIYSFNSAVYLLVGFSACITIMGVGAVRNIVKRLEEAETIENQLQQSKTELMISQIQPHFLYNTLNSIRALIKLDPDGAYKMVYNFSTYLRTNMNSLKIKTPILFSNELEHIRVYTEIEKVRFPKINIIFDIGVSDFYIPALTVQPLVENAIKHGVSMVRTGGTVTIKSYEEGKYYVVQVIDDGIGFDKADLELKDKSFGLKNIEYRLQKISGACLDISSQVGVGTRATVRIEKDAQERLGE